MERVKISNILCLFFSFFLFFFVCGAVGAGVLAVVDDWGHFAATVLVEPAAQGPVLSLLRAV